MKIREIHIQNFRGYRDAKIPLNRYSCFVGPNGAGKSTVLAALNVFFQEKDAAATDVTRLAEEDYFRRDTSKPIRITLIFDELSEEAQQSLAAYVRQGLLVVTAEAKFEPQDGCAEVRYIGQRLVMEAFRPFFDADKAKASAAELKSIYDELRQQFSDLPSASSKQARKEALNHYESEHPEECVLIPSADNFYGVNSTGKLSEFVQWVYVPAVKDAHEEGQEARNTSIGKLVALNVRARTNFDEELSQLREETLTKYQELLDNNQDALASVSKSLQERLGTWAHPNVTLQMQWLSDPDKSVAVQQPVAGIRTGEDDFVGSLARMGHGLQRSYLLALLQELASSGNNSKSTLILGCEEPELYQHPPQARHLADVFGDLAEENSQIIVTTHSPLFVRGKGFEDVRLVCRQSQEDGVRVQSLTFDRLCNRIRDARGEDTQRRIEGLVAKIHQSLQPGLAEMFFARVPVLVEGLEDVAYITTALHLSKKWSEFRRLGCHLIPVNGKDKLIQPLAIAKELGVPVFVIFDADGNTTRSDHRTFHEKDNNAIVHLLNIDCVPFPEDDIFGNNHAIWSANLGDMVKAEFGDSYDSLADSVRVDYANEGGLGKQELFITGLLTKGHEAGVVSNKLQRLCDSILVFAQSC